MCIITKGVQQTINVVLSRAHVFVSRCSRFREMYIAFWCLKALRFIESPSDIVWIRFYYCRWYKSTSVEKFFSYRFNIFSDRRSFLTFLLYSEYYTIVNCTFQFLTFSDVHRWSNWKWRFFWDACTDGLWWLVTTPRFELGQELKN